MRASIKTAWESAARRIALALLVSSGAVIACAAQTADQNAPDGAGGCGAFAWPVANELKWFAEKDLRRSVSGVRLSQIDRAVDLTLKPTKSIQFFLPPEQTPKPDSFSGEVTFRGVPRPGLYQVTISRDAWIDLFENGARLAYVGVTEVKDCDGVRKSLRYKLAPGDLVLVQVSGASEPSIKVAFEAAP